MKKFSFGSALAVIIIMAFSVSTIAQPRWGNRGQGQGKGMKGQQTCVQMIPDLTEDQEKQIEDLRTDHWNAMSEYRSDMRILKAEYHDLTTGEDRNVNKAENKIDEITDLKNKMMKERQNHKEQIRNLLNDDQKTYFDQKMQHRGPCMGMRAGKGHGFGKGFGRKGHQGWHGKGWQGKPGGCDSTGPRWMNDDND